MEAKPTKRGNRDNLLLFVLTPPFLYIRFKNHGSDILGGIYIYIFVNKSTINSVIFSHAVSSAKLMK